MINASLSYRTITGTHEKDRRQENGRCEERRENGNIALIDDNSTYRSFTEPSSCASIKDAAAGVAHADDAEHVEVLHALRVEAVAAQEIFGGIGVSARQ